MECRKWGCRFTRVWHAAVAALHHLPKATNQTGGPHVQVPQSQSRSPEGPSKFSSPPVPVPVPVHYCVRQPAAASKSTCCPGHPSKHTLTASSDPLPSFVRHLCPAHPLLSPTTPFPSTSSTSPFFGRPHGRRLRWVESINYGPSSHGYAPCTADNSILILSLTILGALSLRLGPQSQQDQVHVPPTAPPPPRTSTKTKQNVTEQATLTLTLTHTRPVRQPF